MSNQPTVISDDLTAGDEFWQYDEHAKNLLADKEILAYILKYTTEEFRNMPVREIISCIEGTPQVSRIPVFPGLTNAPKITGENTEDNIPGEGFITFDIKTSVVTKEHIKIIIDMEAQKSIKLKYPIEKRMVYYISRMISSQKNKEFTGDEYQNLKKVYSIWICMNVEEKDKRDSITKFSLTAENVLGHYLPEKENYDLMTGVLICISDKVEDEPVKDNKVSADDSEITGNNKLPDDERKLIGLLKTIFSDELSNEKKKVSLQNDYDIQMNENIDRELMVMSNLGYGVYERGMERGLEKGEVKNLFRLVQKKYIKGKSCDEAAEELETDLFVIEQIYEVIENASPDSSEKELLDILVKKNLLQDMAY